MQLILIHVLFFSIYSTSANEYFQSKWFTQRLTNPKNRKCIVTDCKPDEGNIKDRFYCLEDYKQLDDNNNYVDVHEDLYFLCDPKLTNVADLTDAKYEKDTHRIVTIQVTKTAGIEIRKSTWRDPKGNILSVVCKTNMVKLDASEAQAVEIVCNENGMVNSVNECDEV